MPSYRDNRHIIDARGCISDREYRIGGVLSIAVLRSGGGERPAMELLRDWGELSRRSYLLYGVELRYLFGGIPSHT